MFSHETIVAPSTPPGVSAIAVIRLSGNNSVSIAESLFRGKKLSQQSSHTLHHGWINDGKQDIDEVVVGIFKAPNSYTGEDVVEISCHGSPFIVQRIIELLVERGARTAKPGEFTQRAFLNGKLDLSQAEAVADMISSNSEAARKAAINQMRGGFSNKIKEMRQQLIDFAALVELELDFSEEDVEFANREHLKELVTQLNTHISGLIDSFKLGNVIKHGVNVVIAGRPNAGKSTLLNRLLNEERAIVSDIPGTTRDTIEEVLNIDGILFRLIDTAGIREAQDAIEKIGVEKTYQKIKESEILMYVFDVSGMKKEDVQQDLQLLLRDNAPLILIGNKTDLLKKENGASTEFNDAIFISSKSDENLHPIKEALLSKMEKQLLTEDVVVTNARHHDALLRSKEALDEVLKGLDVKISGELLALDIRRALDALGEITGQIVNDDVLDSVFSRFCIGK